jgi:UDP-N-acetylglucosamine 2-epimerase (non-hydrolysing)
VLRVTVVIGTRPQIIKTAPVIQEALSRGLELDIVHTGQHYDYELSQIFIEEFGLPEPDVNLEVGSGSHAYQTGEIMLRLEKHLLKSKPSIVLIPGDTNSALAGALTAVKLGFPVAHVEAGARCYDMSMAEEVNRRLIDHCSKILFAPTENCKMNLERESVLGDIYLTGDTMYDVFLRFKHHVDSCDILDRLKLSDEEYALLTLHRAENVDDAERLKNIFNGIVKSNIKIVFPIHPRTKNRLKDYSIHLENTNIKVIKPVGYLEMLKLLKHAKIVLTDSGGLQKEALWSKTPCITLRDRTEWIETVKMGVNFITGADPSKILQALEYLEKNYDEVKKRFKDNPFGDGKASERIVTILKEV